MTKRKALTRQADPAAAAQIRRWLIEGHSPRDIQTAAAEHFPGQPVEQILVAIADALVAELSLAADRPELTHAWALQAIREVYRRALEAGDYAAALRAIAKLLELTPTED